MALYAGVIFCLISAAVSTKPKRPNFVLVVADDLVNMSVLFLQAIIKVMYINFDTVKQLILLMDGSILTLSTLVFIEILGHCFSFISYFIAVYCYGSNGLLCYIIL